VAQIWTAAASVTVFSNMSHKVALAPWYQHSH